MQHFARIARYNTVALREELSSHPDLWNSHRFRTDLGETSPFYETDDIWVRFRPFDELKEPRHFNEPHFAAWYPAWDALPSLHPIVFDLMARTKAVHLGGILITRVSSGGRIKPHHDRGGWHAEFYNCKAYLAIDTNERCATYCEDEIVAMKTGEAWRFNNLVVHGLENDGESDRISAIICMRVE